MKTINITTANFLSNVKKYHLNEDTVGYLVGKGCVISLKVDAGDDPYIILDIPKTFSVREVIKFITAFLSYGLVNGYNFWGVGSGEENSNVFVTGYICKIT